MPKCQQERRRVERDEHGEWVFYGVLCSGGGGVVGIPVIVLVLFRCFSAGCVAMCCAKGCVRVTAAYILLL